MTPTAEVRVFTQYNRAPLTAAASETIKLGAGDLFHIDSYPNTAPFRVELCQPAQSVSV